MACKLQPDILGSVVPRVVEERLAVVFAQLQASDFGNSDGVDAVGNFTAAPFLNDAAAVGKEVDDICLEM